MHIVMVTNVHVDWRNVSRIALGRLSIRHRVLDVDKSGKSTGRLATVCKVKFNKKNELEIDNYFQDPFRLANVYLQNNRLLQSLDICVNAS